MSGGTRNAPRWGRGAREIFRNRPLPVTLTRQISIAPNIDRIDGAGDEHCLLSFLRGWSEGGSWWPTAIPRDGGGATTATFTDPAKLTEWIDVRRGVDNLDFHVNDLSPNIRRRATRGT